jgi:hypothetical protein
LPGAIATFPIKQERAYEITQSPLLSLSPAPSSTSESSAKDQQLGPVFD